MSVAADPRSPTSRGCGGPRERSLLQLAGARSDRRAAGARSQGRSAGRAAGSRGPISCAAAILPGVPVDPTGAPVPARSRHRPRHRLADVQPQSAARSACGRCDEHRHSRACLPRAARPGGRQLPQRLHPPPAARAVASSVPARAARRAATRCAGPTTSRWSATSCSAAAAARARRRSRSAIRSSSSLTWRVFVLHCAVFGADPLLVPRLVFACAMIVLFAIDLEHQLLPNVDHAPGIVVGLLFSLLFPPGPWRRADRHADRRRRRCG